MNEHEFLGKMEDILDTDVDISLDSKLADFEDWDSIAFVSFLSLAVTVTKRRIAPDEVKSAVTVGDLYKLLED